MNTNALKKFAQESRRKLLSLVAARLEYVLTTDSAELREKATQVKSLQEAINSSSKESLIDKVAYTWFNRLMALRFMDVNEYQPLGIKVITPKDGYTLPEILDEAKQGHIPSDLKVNTQRLYDLLDGKIPSNNPQNEVYAALLIAACNHLHTVFPFLFEKINDYTELLLPEDLTSEFSIIQDFIKGMSAEDCEQVEVIGWLYQFYISEKKDQVFASKAAVKKEDIPAATQLFTPRWIVEYMVQNTVGKLWLQNKPQSKLRDHMPYFIESPSVTADDYLKINSVEEITLLDQACGSGHILVYGFELLTKIYEEEGYNANEIPQLIIEKNLFGFEIDERAAQLAGMALMLKARSYNRRFFRKEVKPNILCYVDLPLSSEEIDATFSQIGLPLSDTLKHDLNTMQQATNFGSLILPHTLKAELEKAFDTVNKINDSDAFLSYQLLHLKVALEQLLLLSDKYCCVVDNPPYLSSDGMNPLLTQFTVLNYPKSKTDLMACFMESGLKSLKNKGFLGMINQHSWMFLSSYESLRNTLIDSVQFDTSLHLGARTFPEISGEVVQSVSFTITKKSPLKPGVFFRLINIRNSEDKRQYTLQTIANQNETGKFLINQSQFKLIPASRIGYWFNKEMLKSFKEDKLGELHDVKAGVLSGNDPIFVKNWTEVGYSDIGFNLNNYEEYISENPNWVPITNGGSYRRWFGNLVNIMYLKDAGYEIRNRPNNNHRLRDSKYYFILGINWTLQKVRFSVRESSKGILFGNGSRTFFTPESEFKYYIGLFNSKVVENILSLYNPTTNFVNEDIKQVPICIEFSSQIDELVSSSIDISKVEWNSRELSWDFGNNEIIRIKGQDLPETYDLYQHWWKNKFLQLHKNEEELNRQFIEIYGLQDELTPDVPLEDITILKEETVIKNGQLVFKADEVFRQFMSYAVGCMFGRYSLDKEGLILANQGETMEDYLAKVAQSEVEVSFLPDADNIIPILDDEWFEDDIVARFYEFLKVTFGAANFEKNLAFVEDALGKDIRKYFVKDFYQDHIRRYKKRPIYWMFSSPKGSFNVLVYMHRYTPDTLNKILNKYLIEYREKLNTHIEHLEHLMVSGSSAEQTKAAKEKDKLKLVLIELVEYEREILYPLAIERIAIDLDEGVLVNYNKFGKAIKEVAGLNDKKTKDKVKGFDWIDKEMII